MCSNFLAANKQSSTYRLECILTNYYSFRYNKLTCQVSIHRGKVHKQTTTNDEKYQRIEKT